MDHERNSCSLQRDCIDNERLVLRWGSTCTIISILSDVRSLSLRHGRLTSYVSSYNCFFFSSKNMNGDPLCGWKLNELCLLRDDPGIIYFVLFLVLLILTTTTTIIIIIIIIIINIIIIIIILSSKSISFSSSSSSSSFFFFFFFFFFFSFIKLKILNYRYRSSNWRNIVNIARNSGVVQWQRASIILGWKSNRCVHLYTYYTVELFYTCLSFLMVRMINILNIDAVFTDAISNN